MANGRVRDEDNAEIEKELDPGQQASISPTEHIKKKRAGIMQRRVFVAILFLGDWHRG